MTGKPEYELILQISPRIGLCVVGVRHSVEYDATGQVTPRKKFQRGRRDGRWHTRGCSREVS